MKSIEEARETSKEMAEMLQGADEYQKTLIRGILIGAKLKEKPTLNDMRKEHGLEHLPDGNVTLIKS